MVVKTIAYKTIQNNIYIFTLHFNRRFLLFIAVNISQYAHAQRRMWKIGSGKPEVENRKWKTGSGKPQVENRKWKTGFRL
jgi:hypothetical protein